MDSGQSERHNLQPSTHLHLAHNKPLHERLARIQQLFENHPVLGQKTARINSLAADRPIENKVHVAHLANTILNHEKPLWANIKVDPKSLQPHLDARELSEIERKNVEKHAAAVNKLVDNHFASLVEFALISKQKAYSEAHHDYQRFMAVAGASEHIDQMQELLEQQHLMLRKLDARLNLDAHRVTPLIEDIKLSLLDQQALAARLPEFKFR